MGFLSSNISMKDPPKELTVWTPTPHLPGRLSCYFGQKEFFATKQTGIMRSIQTLKQQSNPKFPSLYIDEFHWIDFVYDIMTKQILVRRTEKRGDKETQEIIGYIGPKGYSGTKNPAFGIFGKPLGMPFTFDEKDNNFVHFYFSLYDPAAHRFYRIEMDAERKVVDQRFFYTLMKDSIKIIEGPVVNQPDWAPIEINRQLSRIPENTYYHGSLDMQWNPPSKTIRLFHPSVADQYIGVDPNSMPNSEYTYEKIFVLKNAPVMQPLKKDFFVLHENGRIDYLDETTLNIVHCAGYLPEVGFYKDSLSRRPHDMADYEVQGFYDPNGIFLGMAVATVSRDSVMMAMDFYNTKGNLSAHRSNNLCIFFEKWMDCTSSIQLIMGCYNGLFDLTVRYLLENMQPPLLRLLDMPAAEWLAPDNRYNTIFVHPNSFVGLMKFEYDRFGFWWQLLLLMLPSLAVGGWLGNKARQTAGVMGYNEFARDGWFVAVLAFGIPAYITFRLMLPKERMVTCANCGNPRRVEFEACQSCKRDWQKTKSLTTAPGWVVRDTAKTIADNPPAV
jgi:hypothetical protein